MKTIEEINEMAKSYKCGRQEKLDIANTIIRQFGGHLRSMVGAHNILATDCGVQFDFKVSRKYNRCRVTLDMGADLYIFELYQVSRKYPGRINRRFVAEDVYCDMLRGMFEEETGLTLGRPVVRFR